MNINNYLNTNPGTYTNIKTTWLKLNGSWVRGDAILAISPKDTKFSEVSLIGGQVLRVAVPVEEILNALTKER